VLRQDTDFDYEILVGDDCSTDSTKAILLDLQAQHPDRIRVLLSPVNHGASSISVFASLLAAATGEYVAYLDGDDYWTRSDKLRLQVAYLDANAQCGLCFHNALIVFEDGRRSSYTYNRLGAGSGLRRDALWRYNFIPSHSVLFRRALMPTLPEWFDNISLGDWALWLVLAQRGDIGYIDEVMGIYRKHQRGVWAGVRESDRLEMNVAFCEQMNRHFGFAFDTELRMTSSLTLVDLAREHEQHGDLQLAAAALSRAFEQLPASMAQENTLLGRPALRQMKRKRWLYLHPPIYRLHRLVTHSSKILMHVPKALQPLRNDLRRLWLEGSAHLRSVTRRASGRSYGKACSAAFDADSFGLGVSTLRWRAEGTDTVEVRVNAADGPLLTRARSSGEVATGHWVRDGMEFYLQDASGSAPTSRPAAEFLRVRSASMPRPSVCDRRPSFNVTCSNYCRDGQP
jgi:Glycosyl transferase family 2